MKFTRHKVKFTAQDKKKLFFTSDMHFGHTNIITYCDRPYKTASEMDEALVANWNSVVPEDGIVINCGDLTFYREKDLEKILWLLSRLNGTMILIPGNHDYSWLLKVLEGVDNVLVADRTLDIEVSLDDSTKAMQRIVCCHFPMVTWNHSHQGAWQLFGHHHGTFTKEELSRLTYAQAEVCVEDTEYTPAHFEAIHLQMNNQFMKRS